MTVETRQQHHSAAAGIAGGLPLMRELTALSRTRSLRDPSTSSVLKSPLVKGTPAARKLDHARRDQDTRGKDRSTGVCEQQQQEHRNDNTSAQTVSNDSEVRRVKGEDRVVEDPRSCPTNSAEKPSKRNRKPQLYRTSNRGESLSRKIITQLQQQQQALATQGQSPSPLSLGVFDDPSLKFAPRRKSNNNSFESDQDVSVEEEFEDDEQQQVQKVSARSRSQSPLLSRDISTKSRSPVVPREIIKSRAFSFQDPGQHPFHDEELECTEEPKHGCGIPWHWSRLGQKPRATIQRKPGDQVMSRSHSGSGRELTTSMFPPQECLSYSSAGNSDAEVLPLLTEPEASGSGDVAGSSVEVDSDNVGPRDNASRRKSYKKTSRSQMATEILQARLRERINWINERRLMHDEAETSMQQKSLSYKYRPRSFRDIIGQNVVTQSLSNAVLRGRIVPVYLFQGPHGTGKSSAARVFAAALNCLSSEELRPCGLCRECVVLNLGKSVDVREFDASRFGKSLDTVKQFLENVLLPPSSARYRVSIVDECHALSAESWNVFFKAIEDPPPHSIIILMSTSPEQLPRSLASRCQKFPFTKIKDVEIISRLQKLSTKERIDVEVEALELIASRSNGSLRDAETTLDQLGLLGEEVTLATVQELAGLLPDDKLMDLLDCALSGDTVNTVRSVRYLLESGVEPLALMSQLATLITDLLAGSHKPAAVQRKGRFFHRNTLRKDDLERLRRALKILLEAEKQVRASSDQTTWLTAAILQFAPDRAYVYPASSSRSSATQSLVASSDTSDKETMETESGGLKQGWEQDHEQFDNQVNDTAVFSRPETVSGTFTSAKSLSTVPEARIHPFQSTSVEGHSFDRKKLEDVWHKTLKNSCSRSLKHFLRSHAKLVSLSMREVRATAEIEFGHPKRKAKADKLKSRISHAFQGALGCPVEVHIKLAPKLPEAERKRTVPIYPLCGDSLHRKAKRDAETSPSQHQSAQQRSFKDQFVSSSSTSKKQQQHPAGVNEERLETAWVREAQKSTPTNLSSLEPPQFPDKHWSLADADSERVPVALAMQQQQQQHQLQGLQPNPEQHQQQQYSRDLQHDLTGPLKFRRVRHLGPEVIIPPQSEFEHSNLRLESRTKTNRRLLCCWKTPRGDDEKKVLKQRRRRRRRACFFLRLVPCAQVCAR